MTNIINENLEDCSYFPIIVLDENTLRSFPDQPHSMHRHDPALFVSTVTAWLAERGLGTAVHTTSTVTSHGDNHSEQTLQGTGTGSGQNWTMEG